MFEFILVLLLILLITYLLKEKKEIIVVAPKKEFMPWREENGAPFFRYYNPPDYSSHLVNRNRLSEIQANYNPNFTLNQADFTNTAYYNFATRKHDVLKNHPHFLSSNVHDSWFH